MWHKEVIRWIAVSAALLAAAPVSRAQISIHQGYGAHNKFDGNIVAEKSPVSEDLDHGGDVWIEHDLEVGGQLYLQRVLYLWGESAAGGDADQTIYFYDDDDREDEYLAWKDADGMFELSQSLAILGGSGPTIQVANQAYFVLASKSDLVSFIADSDDNGAGSSFTWYEDGSSDEQRLMELVENGNLTIAGTLTQEGFGLAGGYWKVGEVAPGDLVAIDPSRPHAVRATSAAYDRRVVGVASTDPAVVLGGGVFSLDALGRRWGEEAVEVYLRERPALEAAVYAEREEMRTELLRLSSPSRFAEYLLSVEARPTSAAIQSDDDSPSAPRDQRLSPRELNQRYESALLTHEQRLGDLTMKRFFRERYVPVALAGRSPVRASASFGAIAAGDPLTSSPIPGVAMKATEAGPVIGTALEPVRAGIGAIQALIHRSWYAGDRDRRLLEMNRDPGRRDIRVAQLEAENDRLAARLGAVEAKLEALSAGSPGMVAAASGFGVSERTDGGD